MTEMTAEFLVLFLVSTPFVSLVTISRNLLPEGCICVAVLTFRVRHGKSVVTPYTKCSTVLNITTVCVYLVGYIVGDAFPHAITGHRESKQP